MTDNEHSQKIMNQSQYSNLNIRIPKELHQKLKDACHQRRDSITAVLTNAINEYLNEDNECNEDNEDSAAAQDIPDRADEIDEIKNILRQQQKQLDQHQQSLDNSNLEERLERLENIEGVIEQKIDQQQLDERLSMATMPIWESLEAIEVENNSDTANTNQDIVGDTSGEQIDDNPNSASQDYSSLEVVDETNDQDLGSQPTLNDPALEHLRQLKLNQWQSQHTIIKHKKGLRKHLGYSTETKLSKSPSYEEFEEGKKSLFSIFNRDTNQTEIWEIKSRKPHYLFCFVRVSQKKS